MGSPFTTKIEARARFAAWERELCRVDNQGRRALAAQARAVPGAAVGRRRPTSTEATAPTPSCPPGCHGTLPSFVISPGVDCAAPALHASLSGVAQQFGQGHSRREASRYGALP